MANLRSAVEASEDRPLANLLVGLNVAHVGGTGSQVLARAFGSLDRIMAATEEELAEVEGIGPTIAASVHSFFANAPNRELIERLRAAGHNFAGPAALEAPQVLTGKVGLALSGGGFRASLFHIGVLAKLAELDVLRHVEVLSCVKGTVGQK